MGESANVRKNSRREYLSASGAVPCRADRLYCGLGALYQTRKVPGDKRNACEPAAALEGH